ncbi:MAG TPA: tetratricopeptide repeat protein [Candidatus Polarisedimenticolia bacterium]|nr:tetratricopeptide repeat protein [Candidatus Polarisedimenticolia bacterium]
MTTTICPMLSALKPTDDNGQAVNRECIYEQCRFFSLEQRDCNLMLASRAMIQTARDAASRPATGGPGSADASVGVDLDRRVTEVGKDLLHSSLEVQGVVREAGQAVLERINALETRLSGIDEVLGRSTGIEAALTKRLEETETRLAARLKERIDEVENSVSGALAHRLAGLEQANAQAALSLTTSVEGSIGGLASRLEAQATSAGTVETATTRVSEQVNALAGQVASLVDLQQKVADRLLEEMSLLVATVTKHEQALAGLDKKMDRAAEDNLQVSQLITLVKGQAEKTHAALRTINEGNRSVILAIETQLQRDQADLSRKRADEALECNNRGVALYYRGALEGARDAFQQALKLQPEYSEAWNNLGLALSRLGQEKGAVEAFQKALTIDPRLGETYNNLGFLYHASSQFERAIEMFGQAIENAADSSIAYTNLGNSFYKMKQSEKAVEAWRRALELDPMNENARRGLRMFQQEPASN